MRFLFGLNLALLLLSGPVLKGQNKYWVYNNGSLPQDLQILLPKPCNCSEWLSACTYFLEPDAVIRLRAAGVRVAPVLAFAPAKASHSSFTVGFALEQVEAHLFIQQGLTGKGVKVGVIDGGFLKADEEENLSHFFDNDLVKGYRDFATPEMKPYAGSKGLDDNHGTEVWKLIGGLDQKKNIRFGLATEAAYYLARTDHGGYERRIEEDFFIQALEWMDSLGVKLINVSLGYSIGFTDPAENYKTHQMNGNASAIARAVEIAALEKGMLIVVAAGNEGGVSSWQVVSTPGDAQHALTVGSSKFQVWDKMNFSSIGPDFLKYVKPDISVYSSSGTSFSTPVVTGMAAGIWQKHPELTNLEIIRIFQQAGHFYPFPNNYLGYGVPTCSKILSIMNDSPPSAPEKIYVPKNVATYKSKSDSSAKYVVAFHKKDPKNVIARVVYRPLGKKIKIKRLDGAVQTSLLIGKEVVEIFWE